jgi:hypothetical protein
MRKKSKTDVHVSGFYVAREFWKMFEGSFEDYEASQMSRPEKIRAAMRERIRNSEKRKRLLKGGE